MPSGHTHGFLMVTAPNPPPPAGTTADMILRHDADGLYEIYDIGGNAFLAANFLGQVGTDFQFAGLGSILRQRHHRHAVAQRLDRGLSRSTTSSTTTSPIPPRWAPSGSIFSSRASAISTPTASTDMVLRNRSTGQFELYNIRNNAITSASNLGTVGLNFQVAGFGDFNADGTTDMMLRNVTTGQFELYDIVNNQITSAFNIGTVGLDFAVAGFADFNQDGTTDMMLRNSNTGQFEVYDIRNNAITSAFNIGTVGPDFQVAGFGPFHAAGASDMVLRNANTGEFFVYDIVNNQITTANSLGSVGLDWSVGGFAVDPPSASGGFADASNDQLVQAMAGFGGERCSGKLECCRLRFRHVTAGVADDAAARVISAGQDLMLRSPQGRDLMLSPGTHNFRPNRRRTGFREPPRGLLL